MHGYLPRRSRTYAGHMGIVVAVLVVVFVVGLSWAMLTRRVRGHGCCAVADPRRDLGIRDAFTDEHSCWTTPA